MNLSVGEIPSSGIAMLQSLCFLILFSEFSFLSNVSQKKFNLTGQSPCHHQTLNILLSLPPFSPPQLGSSGGGGRTIGWCSTSHWGRSNSPYIPDEALDVDIGQSFCKQAESEGFNFYTSYFNEGTDLILCGHHLIVLQDED